MTEKKKVVVIKGKKDKVVEDQIQLTDAELEIKNELKEINDKFLRMEEILFQINEETTDEDKKKVSIYDNESAYAMIMVSAFRRLEQILDKYFGVEEPLDQVQLIALEPEEEC